MMMRVVLVALVATATAANDEKTKGVLCTVKNEFNDNNDKLNQVENDDIRDFNNKVSDAKLEIDIATQKMNDADEDAASASAKIEGHKSRQAQLDAELKASRESIQDCKNEMAASKRILGEQKSVLNAEEEDAKVALGAVRDAQGQIASLLQTASIDNYAHKAASALIQMYAPSDEQKGIDNNYQAQTGGVMAQLKALEKKFKAQRDSASAKRAESVQTDQLLQTECATVTKNQEARVASLSTKKQKTNAALADDESAKTTAQREMKLMQTQIDRANARIGKLQRARAADKKAFAAQNADDREAIDTICNTIYNKEEHADKKQACHNDKSSCRNDFEAAEDFVENGNFVQLSSSGSGIAAVSSMLLKGSRSLKQPMLAQLATEMAMSVSRGNPMKKIEDMIYTMINKLKDEALKERSMEDTCDSSLAINKEERKKRRTDMNTNFAEMKEQQALSQKAANQMSDIKDQLDDLEFKRHQEAESFKTLDHKRLHLQESYQQGIDTLETIKENTDFGKTQLVNDDTQNGTKIAGETHKESGALDAVIQSLKENIEMIQNARDEARENEDQALRDHKDETSALNTDNDHRNQQKTDADSAASTAEQRHATEKKAFDAAKDEETRLKAECTDREESFEERTARRENTIAMLKDARQMLESRSQ